MTGTRGIGAGDTRDHLKPCPRNGKEFSDSMSTPTFRYWLVVAL